MNKHLQNSTNETKDRVTRTPLKTGDDLMCSGRVRSSCSTSDTNLRVDDSSSILVMIHVQNMHKYTKQKIAQQ
jgi:hypothetical protein